MLGWLFGDGKASEARQLNRDAPLIVEQAESMFSKDSLAHVADLVRDHIERAHRQYGTANIDFQRAIQDYKKLHKDARWRNDQRALSAMTLVIIYLRSEIAGDLAEPARRTIEDYMMKYLPPGDSTEGG